MLSEFAGKTPHVHETAYVAPNAMVCGDVTIGPNTRVMFGAQVIAEGGSIQIGAGCIVLENAVLRSTRRHSLRLGDNCLVGPNAHLVGCTIEPGVFIATGASVFHSAHICSNSEVRINGIVHLKTRLEEGSVVPIGWVAVGDPAAILPPEKHDEIWEKQAPLNFPMTVYGLQRADANVANITKAFRESLALDDGS